MLTYVNNEKACDEFFSHRNRLAPICTRRKNSISAAEGRKLRLKIGLTKIHETFYRKSFLYPQRDIGLNQARLHLWQIALFLICTILLVMTQLNL